MKNLLFFCLMAISIFTASCKKEEVQQNDIVGKWTAKEILANGTNQLGSGTFTFDFKKDKTYEVYYNFSGQSATEQGTWSVPSESKLFMKANSSSSTGQTFEILKLEYPLFAKAILQFQYTSGSNTYRYNFEK